MSCSEVKDIQIMMKREEGWVWGESKAENNSTALDETRTQGVLTLLWKDKHRNGMWTSVVYVRACEPVRTGKTPQGKVR